jgi:hypothetical protein
MLLKRHSAVKGFSMKHYVDFYLTSMKIAVQEQFQYPVANYFYMIGMIAEPVIYLVVWSAVANLQGGTVGGYGPGYFAAYYIVWTLVRNMDGCQASCCDRFTRFTVMWLTSPVGKWWLYSCGCHWRCAWRLSSNPA